MLFARPPVRQAHQKIKKTMISQIFLQNLQVQSRLVLIHLLTNLLVPQTGDQTGIQILKKIFLRLHRRCFNIY
jgi:uncharacterized membrane protein